MRDACMFLGGDAARARWRILRQRTHDHGWLTRGQLPFWSIFNCGYAESFVELSFAGDMVSGPSGCLWPLASEGLWCGLHVCNDCCFSSLDVLNSFGNG